MCNEEISLLLLYGTIGSSAAIILLIIWIAFRDSSRDSPLIIRNPKQDLETNHKDLSLLVEKSLQCHNLNRNMNKSRHQLYVLDINQNGATASYSPHHNSKLSQKNQVQNVVTQPRKGRTNSQNRREPMECRSRQLQTPCRSQPNIIDASKAYQNALLLAEELYGIQGPQPVQVCLPSCQAPTDPVPVEEAGLPEFDYSIEVRNL